MLPVTPLTPSQVAAVNAAVRLYPWWRRAFISFDQMCNVWFFHGYCDETVSAHAGRAAVRDAWWAVDICDLLDRIEKDHGALAIEGDLERAEMIEQIEDSSGELPHVD